MRLTQTLHGLLLQTKKLHRLSSKLRPRTTVESLFGVIMELVEFHPVFIGDMCIPAHVHALIKRVELVPVATAAAVVKLFALLDRCVVEVLRESEA